MKCYNCRYQPTNFLFYSKCYITGDKFKIFKCDNCYTISPRPQPKILDKFYPNNYRKYKFFIKYIREEGSLTGISRTFYNTKK